MSSTILSISKISGLDAVDEKVSGPFLPSAWASSDAVRLICLLAVVVHTNRSVMGGKRRGRGRAERTPKAYLESPICDPKDEWVTSLLNWKDRLLGSLQASFSF